jgi:hypothetical protein
LTLIEYSQATPVPVWGMIGDNMMVSDDNRSLWLVIGLVTLAVMVFAGNRDGGLPSGTTVATG